MIIRNSRNWFTLLFVWRGSVLKKILPQLGILTLFSAGVCVFHGWVPHYTLHINPVLFTLLGLSLAIFMGFCNTASYDRFWEGRKLWGSLVIETRSLVRQVLTLVESDRAEKVRFVNLVVAFCWALNFQLRKKDGSLRLRRVLLAEDYAQIENKVFKPVALLDLMAAWVAEKLRTGGLDPIRLAQIDVQLNALSNVAGGCERIASTPLPFPYRLLLHRTAYLYCFFLPFGLVEMLGWATPFLVLFISYTFIGLDAVIDEVSEPFGEEENDLALDTICHTIAFSVREQAGMEQAPLVKPDRYVLR